MPKNKLIMYIVIALIIIGALVYVFVYSPQQANHRVDIDANKYLQQIDQSQLNEAQTTLYTEVSEKLQANGQDAEAIRDLANLFYFINDADTAEEIYSQLLKVTPGDIIVLNNLANVYRDQQRYELAEQTYYHSLSVNILWIETYEALSEMYRFKLVPANDEFPATIQQARDVDFQDQYEQLLLKKLAFYYYYQEDTAQALKYFTEYLDKYPDDEQIKPILQELQGK